MPGEPTTPESELATSSQTWGETRSVSRRAMLAARVSRPDASCSTECRPAAAARGNLTATDRARASSVDPTGGKRGVESGSTSRASQEGTRHLLVHRDRRRTKADRFDPPRDQGAGRRCPLDARRIGGPHCRLCRLPAARSRVDVTDKLVEDETVDPSVGPGSATALVTSDCRCEFLARPRAPKREATTPRNTSHGSDVVAPQMRASARP